MTSQVVSLQVTASIPIDCDFWSEDDGWKGPPPVPVADQRPATATGAWRASGFGWHREGARRVSLDRHCHLLSDLVVMRPFTGGVTATITHLCRKHTLVLAIPDISGSGPRETPLLAQDEERARPIVERAGAAVTPVAGLRRPA